jgi:hypothetical protein
MARQNHSWKLFRSFGLFEFICSEMQTDIGHNLNCWGIPDDFCDRIIWLEGGRTASQCSNYTLEKTIGEERRCVDA